MEEEKKSVEVPVAGAVPGAGVRPNGKPVISDPMAGRDTDTGNLEILTDTATRRTVKLKPIAPHPVVNPASRLSITPAAPAVKPVIPPSDATQTIPKEEIKVEKPVAVANSAEDDKTAKVQRMPKPVVPFDASADKATVKLPPPRRVTPPPAVVKPTMPTAVKPVPVKPLPAAVGSATTKLPVMEKPVAPVPPPSVPDLSDAPEEAVVAPELPVSAAIEAEEGFSKGCSAMQIVSAVLIACAVVMVLLQFVDVCFGTGISSFIPGAK